MPEVHPLLDALGGSMGPPEPRTALFWDGTHWHFALVDAAGHLQVDTVTSALPAGAATEATLATLATEATLAAFAAAGATAANQALILAQLQLIEDMRDALQSVATDRLIVRGEDQLFSFKGVLADDRSAAVSGADGWLDSPTVPAGEIWVVTAGLAMDWTTPTTRHMWYNRHDGADYKFTDLAGAFTGGFGSEWEGHIYLDPSDTIRVTFLGSLVGDNCQIVLNGYIMTLEV